MKNVLLVVDLQKQFKDSNGKYDKILDYVKKSSYDAIYGTVFSQNFISVMNPNFRRHLKDSNSEYEKAVICNDCDIEYFYDDVYIKTGYAVNVYEFLKDNGVDEDTHIDIVGFGLSSIMAISSRLWDMFCNFSILNDYTYDAQISDYKDILINNFGTAVI